MSHTNSTTNYNLPQFIGTDKPTWLNDVNGAMSAIDTQMKLNADSATGANTTATTAQTAVGTLANLETTAKTDCVSAINEVNTNVGTAQETANQAYTAGSSALTKVTALEGALNINTVNTCTVTKSSNISSLGSDIIVKCATNSDKSLFKLYGNAVFFLPANTTSAYLTISNTGLGARETEYNIEGCALVFWANGAVGIHTATVKTNGDIVISDINSGNATAGRLYLAPILYFDKSFGD